MRFTVFQDKVFTAVLIPGGYMGIARRMPEDVYDRNIGVAVALMKLKRSKFSMDIFSANPPGVNKYLVTLTDFEAAELFIQRAELARAMVNRDTKAAWSEVFGNNVFTRSQLVEVFAKRFVEWMTRDGVYAGPMNAFHAEIR